MKAQERRKFRRLDHQFPTMIHCRTGSCLSIEGQSMNLSQGGAFVRTKAWHGVRVNDKAVVTFFLPPDFTGHDKTIGLQGEGIITRVDEDNQGVGIKFVKGFKQFEQITVPEVAGEIKYKPVAHYLSIYGNTPPNDFIAKYSNGFLVEKSKKFFDKNVIVQFGTELAEDKYVLEQIKRGVKNLDILKARVIEISKRKSHTDPDTITIGRSPHNDIVLYNKMVSKAHAYIYPLSKGEKTYIVDTKSTNGTFINNKKIPPHEKHLLSDGDEISFGPETRLIYFSPRAFHNFLKKLQPL
ncbi:MAG: FHA domain-containing protein [Deltaproteobacteria bacterium]|nr:FHA domain-containing protein [Deltaproteobacteria bacterium]MBW2071691.1 FHA domain-containing protein [Deltaproteobacteria bacterium]